MDNPAGTKPMKKSTLFLTRAAIIAALYAALTYAASVVGLAYGPIQFRFSEALTVLACFTPAAVPGLTVGCFLGNLGSSLGPIDWVVGTAATLLAALCTYFTRKDRVHVAQRRLGCVRRQCAAGRRGRAGGLLPARHSALFPHQPQRGVKKGFDLKAGRRKKPLTLNCKNKSRISCYNGYNFVTFERGRLYHG